MTDARQLRSFVDRIENIETTLKEYNRDKSEVYKDAKKAGLNVQAVKDVVAHRRDPQKSNNRSQQADEYLGLLQNGPTRNIASVTRAAPTRGHSDEVGPTRAHEAEQTISQSAPSSTIASLRDEEVCGEATLDTPGSPQAGVGSILSDDRYNDVRGTFLDRTGELRV